MCNYLVKSVMAPTHRRYGDGWSERKGLEKVQTHYLRWILKLDFCTPRYLIYKETDSMKLRIKWGNRAVKFEEEISKQGQERLTNKCWLEKIEKVTTAKKEDNTTID